MQQGVSENEASYLLMLIPFHQGRQPEMSRSDGDMEHGRKQRTVLAPVGFRESLEGLLNGYAPPFGRFRGTIMIHV